MKGSMIASVLVLSILALPAFAIKEVITYRTDCKATARGKLAGRASISTPAWTKSNSQSADFGASFGITDPYWLTFGDGRGVSAAVAKKFKDGCKVSASAEVKGETRYTFNGDTISMDFNAASTRSHKDEISRGPSGAAPGGPAAADSSYSIPQSPSLDVSVPFKLADYGYAWTFNATLALRRGDSGATTGSTVGVWQLWRDVNCNCKVDRGDFAIEGDKGIVFPNDSFSNDKTFEVKPGCYVIVYTYFTDSDLSVASANCTETVGEKSEVEDTLNVLITLY